MLILTGLGLENLVSFKGFLLKDLPAVQWELPSSSFPAAVGLPSGRGGIEFLLVSVLPLQPYALSGAQPLAFLYKEKGALKYLGLN